MPKFRLTDRQRRDIVTRFQFGTYTQTALAQEFGVSRKTIYRVLWEAGVINGSRMAVTPEQGRILNLVRHHGLTAESLERALAMPTLSPSNIRKAMLNMDYTDLARYTGDLLRQKTVADMETEAQAQATRRQRQGEMEQEALV